jgi:hypothetical protein
MLLRLVTGHRLKTNHSNEWLCIDVLPFSTNELMFIVRYVVVYIGTKKSGL